MGFAEKVSSFMKSLTGGEEKNNSDFEDTDLENQEDESGEAGGGGEEEAMKKGDLVDATDLLGSLVTELKDMNKSLKALIESQKTLEKSQGDVGDAVVGVAELVARIAGAPIPPKSAMAKGNLGGGVAGTTAPQQPSDKPTPEEFERAQAILTKAFKDGEITLQKSEEISSDLQKSMVFPGWRMKPENYEFIARKMKTA